MLEPMYSTILQHVAYLHRQPRRWRRFGVIALVLLAVVVWHSGVMGQAPGVFDELRTRAVVLVDRENRPRLDLRVARNDSTHLVLMDREGLVRLSLNVLAQGGVDIVLQDQQGAPRAALILTSDGRPSLSFYDAAGTTRVALGLGPDGQSRLILYRPDGTIGGMIP